MHLQVAGQFPGDNGKFVRPRLTHEYVTGDGERIQVGEGLGQSWEFEIGFAPTTSRVTGERLVHLGEVYDSAPVEQNRPNDPVLQVKYFEGKRGRQPQLRFDRSRPVLTQFAQASSGKWKQTDAEKAARLARLLANTQRVDPLPALLRAYSQAHQIRRIGEHGENFAALIRTFCSDPETKDAYLTWLRQLRPAEVDDVGTLSGALGESLFMLREGNKSFPAPVLSDGTLRFAAITAALFQPDMPAIMTIEEIENGVHASRLRLLVELLRSRAATGTTQLMVTTHSPTVLAWLEPEDYAHTFFCKRDEATGESRICPLTEVPNFLDVVKRQPIGDLFAEGWLEAAL